jgi:hypothetical protein
VKPLSGSDYSVRLVSPASSAGCARPSISEYLWVNSARQVSSNPRDFQSQASRIWDHAAQEPLSAALQSVPQTIVDGRVQVFPFLGFGIVAVIYTYEPRAPSTPEDLPDFSCHRTLSWERRHTNGTLRNGNLLSWWEFERRKLIGVQWPASQVPPTDRSSLARAIDFDFARAYGTPVKPVANRGA